MSPSSQDVANVSPASQHLRHNLGLALVEFAIVAALFCDIASDVCTDYDYCYGH